MDSDDPAGSVSDVLDARRAIEEMEVSLLVRCPNALMPVITELAAAQYVCGRPGDSSDWISLNLVRPAGVRRHLAGLLTVPA